MPFFSYTLKAALDPSANPADAALNALPLRTPKDLALDPTTGDLAVTAVLLTGSDAIMQRILIRIRFFLGEWFLDTQLGIPWRERIMIKGVDARDVKQILVKAIESTPGVAQVLNFDCVLDGRTRTLTVPAMTIMLDDGSTIEAKSQEPFIV